MTILDLTSLLEEAEEHYSKGNFGGAERNAITMIEAIDSDPLVSVSYENADSETVRSIVSLRSAALIVRARVLYFKGDIHASLRDAELAYAIAQEHEDVRNCAKALNTIGVAHEALSNHAKALECLHEALGINTELGRKVDIARNYGNIGLVYSNMSDFSQALEYYRTALLVCEEIGNFTEVSNALINVGNAYYNVSDYVKALEYHEKALRRAEELNNKNTIAACLHNIGRVYSSLSDNSKAREYFESAIAINTETGNKAFLANNLDCLGAEYQALSDNTTALQCYFQSLAINEEIGNKNHIAINLTNIGWLYYKNLSDYERALEYTQRALLISEEIGSKDSIGRTLCNLGVVYGRPDFGGYEAARAEEFLLASLAISRETGKKMEECESCMWLADFYKNHQRWEASHGYLEQYIALEKSIVNEESRRQAERVEQTRQHELRERHLIAERTRSQERESILNNILPEEITTRLINGENPIADFFESVSVLFMDIVDFTVLSSKVSARQLVYLLNTIFTAADGVMREFGLEKIKTIGDAYMAVAGAPLVQEDHAIRASHAALKLLDVMSGLVVEFPNHFGDRSWIESFPEIQVRIGLHCGPAAAGVVGENKFFYDLWGDAVNTASRMESHGEAGKIHVSEDFKNCVERYILEPLDKNAIRGLDSPNDVVAGSQHPVHKIEFHFSARGEVDIKGKGMMRTFFLQRI